jgi:hypothetical protein
MSKRNRTERNPDMNDPLTTTNQTTVIVAYTLDDAEADGVLARTDDLFPNQRRHIVSHVTTNLLRSLGYEREAAGRWTVQLASVIDLCNQAGPRIRRALSDVPDEYLVTLRIETPSGDRTTVWAQLNEEGRWTLMLPEDY